MSKKITENTINGLIKFIKNKINNIINDSKISKLSTYSSEKIEENISILDVSDIQINDDLLDAEKRISILEYDMLIMKEEIESLKNQTPTVSTSVLRDINGDLILDKDGNYILEKLNN